MIVTDLDLDRRFPNPIGMWELMTSPHSAPPPSESVSLTCTYFDDEIVTGPGHG